MLDVLDTVDPAAPSLPAPLPLSFRLDAAHEAHEPPEATRPLPRRRPPARVSRAIACRSRPVHRAARPARCRRPPRGQHVGDRRRRPRRRDRRGRARSCCTSPTSCPAACGWSNRAAASPTGRPSRCSSRHLPVTARRPDGAAIVDLLDRPRSRPGCGWRSPPTASTWPRRWRADGRPIRYSYVPRDWPLAAYQTVFATEPGSAEMPSAARPFTAEIVTRLVSRGVVVAPIVLHTGVSSLEGRERPYPERYRVPGRHRRARERHAPRRAPRRRRRHHRGAGARDRHRPDGTTHPGTGWTDVVVTPRRGVRAVDGLLTGWHEPEATHLAMLEAVAGRGCSWRPTRRRSWRATSGTSSATATSCSPMRDRWRSGERDHGRAAGAGRATRRAVRSAPARRASAEDVAADVGITGQGPANTSPPSSQAGLAGAVEADESPRRGRPRLRYHVTAAGDALFPKAYGALTNELLGYVEEIDASGVDRLFERRRDQRVDQRPPAARGTRLARRAGRRAHAHPRRGRVSRRGLHDRARSLPRRRAQLRHRRRRQPVRPGVHQRDRLHPHRPPGRHRRPASATW